MPLEMMRADPENHITIRALITSTKNRKSDMSPTREICAGIFKTIIVPESNQPKNT